jgi:predicted dehydrogenase
MAHPAKTRVGVIGAGAWAATNHIPILAARDDVDLVVACRPGRDELETIRRRFGFAHVAEDYREALSLGVDAVVVASPPALHFEHVSAALTAGAHVLCEKPFTVDPADAWRLIDLAEKMQLHLVLSFGWNWLPAVERAKKLLADCPIGEPHHVVVHMASDVWQLMHGTGSYFEADPDFPPDVATWSNPDLSGGGYAPGQLSHALALFLWLCDAFPEQVTAVLDNATAPVDLFDALLLRFPNGGTGVASGASTRTGGAPREQIEIRIFGTEGHFVLDLEREELSAYTETTGKVAVELAAGDGLYQCLGPPNALIDLARGQYIENRSPASLGASVVEIIAAAEASAKTGTPTKCHRRSTLG